MRLRTHRTEPPDRLIELTDGPRYEKRHPDREEHTQRNRRGELQPEDALRALAVRCIDSTSRSIKALLVLSTFRAKSDRTM